MRTGTDTQESSTFQRYKDAAKDIDNVITMVTVFHNGSDSPKEMNKIAMAYIMDPSYERADICLSLKIVEIENGWR